MNELEFENSIKKKSKLNRQIDNTGRKRRGKRCINRACLNIFMQVVVWMMFSIAIPQETIKSSAI